MPTINLNDATPPAPAGYQNVRWQAVAPPIALAIVGVANSGGLFEIVRPELADDLLIGDSVTVVCLRLSGDPGAMAGAGMWST